MSRIAEDQRIDPKIRKAFGSGSFPSLPHVASREEIFQILDHTLGGGERPAPDLEAYEAAAPSTGLTIRTQRVASHPDGAMFNLQIIVPDRPGPLPCVYYIHGGGMMMGSCYDPSFAAWGRLIAACGVVVVMVDFRNCLMPSSVPELAMYPGGLNDCVSGLRWVRTHAGELGVDPDRIVVAGESGGSNLSIAVALRLKRDGELDSIRGLYLMCPYLAGSANLDPGSSELENYGIMMVPRSNFAAMAYGMEAFESGDPLAWPAFATEADVTGFPPTIVAVNECDPLRDDGLKFYRLLMRAGVGARCRQLMGTVHGTEVHVLACPEISRDAARELAAFATAPA